MTRWGGWSEKHFEGSDFFRTHHDGNRWWLVDPEGRLFWSHGLDCVRENNDTPISDREHYLKWLPEEGSAFAEFYGRGSWAPHGYYKDHSPYRTSDFSRANFLRKFGDDWPDSFAEITHRRL